MKTILKITSYCLVAALFVSAAPGPLRADDLAPQEGAGKADSQKELPAMPEIHCYQSPRYLVVGKDLQERGGTDFLIKDKTSRDKTMPCLYVFEDGDFEIKNEWAEYFAGLTSHFLLLDSSTGPGPGGLTIWDLAKRLKVYQGSWAGPIDIQDDTITYWTETSQASADNCPEAVEWQEHGLGAAIETKVILNLADLTISKTSETRCRPRQ